MKKLLNVKGLRILDKAQQRSINGEGAMGCGCVSPLGQKCYLPPMCTREGRCTGDGMGGAICAPL